MMINLIELKDISKKYVGKNIETNVFSSIELTIHSGDFVTMYGRSGSGKSTLLNILGLVDRPTTGKISFEGNTVQTLSDDQYAYYRNKYIGYIYQDFKLIEDMSVYENIEIPLLFAKNLLPQQLRKQRIGELLHRLNLEGKEEAFPEELSGGQKQRVGIARALVNEPILLLADEPTGNLDKTSAQEVLALLKEIHHDSQMTILIATHDPQIREYGNRVIYVDDGTINEQH